MPIRLKHLNYLSLKGSRNEKFGLCVCHKWFQRLVSNFQFRQQEMACNDDYIFNDSCREWR